MGLDVYLYKYADFEETQRKEREYEAYSDGLWKHLVYADIPEEERGEIRKKEVAFKTSLGIADEDAGKERVELPSPTYPEHIFKIGYFRSSYNDAGLNRILDTVCGKNLYNVFCDETSPMYYVKPDWENAMRVTDDLITKLNDHVSKINVSVSAVDVGDRSPKELPTSTNDALTLYIEEFLRNPSLPFGGAYSNSVGLFSMKSAQKVKAFIPGLRYSRPCVYIIHEETAFSWYIEALEIVKETIQYVLKQPDREKYILHWSS